MKTTRPMSTTRKIHRLVHTLPLSDRFEVLDFVRLLATRRSSNARKTDAGEICSSHSVGQSVSTTTTRVEPAKRKSFSS